MVLVQMSSACCPMLQMARPCAHFYRLLTAAQAARRVGNELGAGSAAGARLAMDAAALTAPALWLAAAAVLGAPPAQRALVGLFTTPGDVALLAELRQLLAIVMAMLLFDGLQTVLQGVVQARRSAMGPADSCGGDGGPICNMGVRALLVALWWLRAMLLATGMQPIAAGRGACSGLSAALFAEQCSVPGATCFLRQQRVAGE